eukprot:7140837-Pyramimonas_sp.AAC.2
MSAIGLGSVGAVRMGAYMLMTMSTSLASETANLGTCGMAKRAMSRISTTKGVWPGPASDPGLNTGKWG